MFGNFTYCNPTKLYFGEDALNGLNTELPKYGKNVVLIYGGGSIKKNGIYDEVIKILKDNGKNVAEISGVMPNPTVDKLYGGVETARRHKADLLLAVGGGSVCDYAKAVSVSVNCDEDPWEKYYTRFEEPACETLPVGCVLTMVGTGSEMNARRGDHQSPYPSEDRPCVCRRKNYAAVRYPEPAIYPDSASLPDGGGHL